MRRAGSIRALAVGRAPRFAPRARATAAPRRARGCFGERMPRVGHYGRRVRPARGRARRRQVDGARRLRRVQRARDRPRHRARVGTGGRAESRLPRRCSLAESRSGSRAAPPGALACSSSTTPNAGAGRARCSAGSSTAAASPSSCDRGGRPCASRSACGPTATCTSPSRAGGSSSASSTWWRPSARCSPASRPRGPTCSSLRRACSPSSPGPRPGASCEIAPRLVVAVAEVLDA